MFHPALDDAARDAVAIRLPKAVFRAVLARIAALCNERTPNSVTPYRGRGELSVGSDNAVAFQVSFTNTPDEQRLELRPLASSADGAGVFAVPQNDSRPVAV